jgi:Uma2 family endonuclease
MGLAQPRMTDAEFLAWEETQADHHQFFEGEVFAIVGGTAEHNTAALSTALTLKLYLKGSPCKVFASDMRVQAANSYFYPDVVVTCAPQDTSNPKATEISSPKLIVEELSPSAAAFDRGLKFAAYRQIRSLEEYLPLDPEAKTAEVFHKNAAGIWELHPSDVAAPLVKLNNLGWAGNMGRLFE